MLRFCTRNRLRQYCSGLGDGYQPFVFSALSSRNAGFESSTSGGKSGQIGGPSAFAVSRPLTNSSESRSCSALSRRGERKREVLRRERWRLPIRGAGGDLPHELLDGPALSHEFAGEPIEQRGIFGPRAGQAEIVRRRDQRAAHEASARRG